LRGLDAESDCVLEPRGGSGPLAQAVRVGQRTVGNRFAVQPMEGWDGTAAGLPTPATLRRWRRFGRFTTDTLDRLCQALEVQPGDLLEWVPHTAPSFDGPSEHAAELD
jgi:hypothetical protein